MTLGQTFLGPSLRGYVGEFLWDYIPGGGLRSRAHTSFPRTPSEAHVFFPRAAMPACGPSLVPAFPLPGDKEPRPKPLPSSSCPQGAAPESLDSYPHPLPSSVPPSREVGVWNYSSSLGAKWQKLDIKDTP